MNSPQPHGVPVRITSPGSSVKLCEQKLISSATPKIISDGVRVLHDLAVDARGRA